MWMNYPERRDVSERTIIAWARDIMADDRMNALPKPATDEAVDREVESTPIPTLDEAMSLLEDRGLATFER